MAFVEGDTGLFERVMEKNVLFLIPIQSTLDTWLHQHHNFYNSTCLAQFPLSPSPLIIPVHHPLKIPFRDDLDWPIHSQ